MRWFENSHIAIFRYFAIATAIVAVCNAEDENLVGRADEDIVQVDIYYTSLCTDASWFVNNQFGSTIEVLEEYMNVEYIPYGRTQHELVSFENGTQYWNFTCQFGSVDCDGNKAHACAINEILTNPAISNEQRLLASFLYCTMNSTNPALFVPQCLLAIGLTVNQVVSVSTCSVSIQGDQLLAAHGDTTQALQPPLNFVPTIIINKVFSQQNQDNSFVDFQGVICQNIPAGSRPAVCSGSTWLHSQKNVFVIMVFSLVFYTGKGLNYFF